MLIKGSPCANYFVPIVTKISRELAIKLREDGLGKFMV